MRNFFQRLMFGRYGADALNNAMLVLCLVLMILSRVLRVGWLDLLSIAVLVICYLRVFSVSGKPEVPCRCAAGAQMVRRHETALPRPKNPPLFYLPQLRHDAARPQGQGQNQYFLPQVQDAVYQENIT